jgi:lactoylglutathione lyase
MKIEHVAMWVSDLEVMKDFYCRYFAGQVNDKYVNPIKGFSSYFIAFASGARLELMHSLDAKSSGEKERLGFIHLAFTVENKAQVNELTNLLRTDGYRVISEPRTTGDGYYESCILDPENNQIEITA